MPRTVSWGRPFRSAGVGRCAESGGCCRGRFPAGRRANHRSSRSGPLAAPSLSLPRQSRGRERTARESRRALIERHSFPRLCRGKVGIGAILAFDDRPHRSSHSSPSPTRSVGGKVGMGAVLAFDDQPHRTSHFSPSPARSAGGKVGMGAVNPRTHATVALVFLQTKSAATPQSDANLWMPLSSLPGPRARAAWYIVTARPTSL